MTGGQTNDLRTDEALVAALNRGDVSAFDTLYYRHRDWVVRTAYRFTGNADDALDVLQETFSYVFSKFPGFILSARMTTFLYPVVKNLAMAARERRSRLISGTMLPEVPVSDHISSDPRAELAAVLAVLPEGQREVLLLRFVDDLSIAEIALALSIPPGTVKSRLHNALTALKKDPRVKEYFLGFE